jgi:hypothetical protein
MNATSVASRRRWVIGGLVTALLVIGVFVWLRLAGGQRATLRDVPAEDEAKRAGREVRYNATISLAAIGSKKVRLDLLAEMLDEDKQLRNCWVKQGGRTVSDEDVARQTILTTLKAIVDWHDKLDVPGTFGRNNPKVQKIYTAIRHLAADSQFPDLQKAAEQVRRQLDL